MNPSTHPHEFIKHTDPDYIIQPGDLYQSTICSTCYGPFGTSVGGALERRNKVIVDLVDKVSALQAAFHKIRTIAINEAKF